MSESRTTTEGEAAPRRERRGRRLPPPAFPPGSGARGARVPAIGDDEGLEATERRLAGDPPVMEVVEMVGSLARALRHQGSRALQVTPEMSAFEATLRAYCGGYIAGRRGEEERP